MGRGWQTVGENGKKYVPVYHYLGKQIVGSCQNKLQTQKINEVLACECRMQQCRLNVCRCVRTVKILVAVRPFPPQEPDTMALYHIFDYIPKTSNSKSNDS